MLTPEFKQGACHAGSYETSLVLAAREELVRPERVNLRQNPVNLAKLMTQGVTSFKDAGAPDAYFGDPASASHVQLRLCMCERGTQVILSSFTLELQSLLP